jgi:hypothetical protein
MVALSGAPEHRRTDRSRRSQRNKERAMRTTTIKRTIATTLGGAAIAGTIGGPAASAMPIDPVRANGQASDVSIVPPTPPSSARTASATDESWQPALSRYYDLEASKAKSMEALGLAMMQRSFSSPYRDVEANGARLTARDG